jgi:hypothetical protein
MKMKLASIIFVLSIVLSAPSHAGLIDFTFEFKTSDFDDTFNLTDGDSLTFSFLDTTNFSMISSSDIFSFKYNLDIADTGTNYYGSGWNNDVGDIGNAFAWDGIFLTLTFDNLGFDYIQGNDIDGVISQVSTSGAFQLFVRNATSNSEIMYAELFDASVARFSARSSAVPEPSTLAIFALGMIGLASRRFKRQS